MADDNLQWLLELAEMIPEDELERRLAEIEERLFELGRVREALRQMQTARMLALAAMGPLPSHGNKTPAVVQATNGHRPNLRNALRAVFREADVGILNLDQIMEALA